MELYEHIDAVGIAEKAAAFAAAQERALYAPFLRAAETYAHQHGLVVGGDTATRLLLNTPLSIDSYVYVFYSETPRRDAEAIARTFRDLDPEGMGRYANARAEVGEHPGETALVPSYVVETNMRLLVRVFGLTGSAEQGRHVRAASVLIPSVCPSRFAPKLGLKCMGPEIQLMSVYKRLSDPSQAGDWADLLVTEKALVKLFQKEIAPKIRRAVAPDSAVSDGGKERQSRIPDFVYPNSPLADRTCRLNYGGGQGARGVFQSLRDEISKKFIPRGGRVLVGPLAADMLSRFPVRGGRKRARPAGGRGPGVRRFQVVSANGLRDEESAVRAIADRVGAGVQSTFNNPRVPTDPGLRRLTMYMTMPPASGRGGGQRRVPFLDVFDAGDRELIPFMSGLLPSVRVGTPPVILRFRLVDAWTMQLLMRMGEAPPGYIRDVLDEIVDDFNTVEAIFHAALAGGAEELERIFPTDIGGYAGVYIDPIRAQRRAIFGARSSIPYYPAANM